MEEYKLCSKYFNNWRFYGEEVLGLRWPFNKYAVVAQNRIVNKIRKEKAGREPEPRELTGAEFIVFVEQYNQRKKDEI